MTDTIDWKQHGVGSQGQNSQAVGAFRQSAIVMQKICPAFLREPSKLGNLIGAAPDVEKRFSAQISFALSVLPLRI